VDHAGGVRRREAGRDLRRERERTIGGERRLTLEEIREGLAFDELHRQEAKAAVLADVEGARDVRARHLPRELHLLSEPPEHLRDVRELAAEHLERDGLAELPIERAIHRAHAAHPEQRDELVASCEEIADLRLGCRRGRSQAADAGHRLRERVEIRHRRLPG
jgi:hypothetical protein